MRVAIVTETFAKNMGYMGSMLPRYMARHGADVHVITTGLAIYHHVKELKGTYAGFTDGERLAVSTVELYDGYTLHVLPHCRLFGYIRMVGLLDRLRSLKPDVVYSLSAIGWIPLDAALIKVNLGYKLFTGSHTTASVFPLARKEASFYDPERIKAFITRAIPGRFVSLFTEKCYGATIDCADIAVRFFGVQKSKIDVCPLGVDTELFAPIRNDDEQICRLTLRSQFGFRQKDIVCIYTGRFAEAKNPIILARAISQLVERGDPYKGLFVGYGVQADAIRALPGCVVHPFVPISELPKFYRGSDIGVWPTQESTSMLDAAACGLPIIVNDTIAARERIDGNGITYRLNDVNDLIGALLSLRDPIVRQKLGKIGSLKIASHFSWSSLALRRLNDFDLAIAERSERNYSGGHMRGREHDAREDCKRKIMLNVGCGGRTHAEWVNIDWSLKGRFSKVPFMRRLVKCPEEEVINHDLRKGIPYGDGAVDVVYAAHLLEHLERHHARFFLLEVRRVLKAGGTVRIVVPDLETAARKYLDALAAVCSGEFEQSSVDRYEWATIRLLDQMVRTTPGGEMVRWLRDHQDSLVMQSLGGTLKEIAKSVSFGGDRSGLNERLFRRLQRRNFHCSGELHRWMYDGFSLRRLLESCGFSGVRSVSHLESRIGGWANFFLDNNPDSSPHQPDSIWMEGTKGDSASIVTGEAGS